MPTSSRAHGAEADHGNFISAVRAVALPFALSRIAVLVVGFLAASVIGYGAQPTGPAAWRVAPDPLHNLLARWDTYWYLDIATHGYHWNGNPLIQQNVVFFPLYPMLLRVVGTAFGGHVLLAGLAISLAAFFVALTYVWRWIADDLGPETATGAVWLLCAFPFSIFFSAVYTESLFLLAVAGALWHARRHDFVIAAVFGLCAGLVRPNGCLVALPLSWLIFAARRDLGSGRASWIAPVIAAIAPVAGVLLFTCYLHTTVGDGFAWVAGQGAWEALTPWGRTAGEVIGGVKSAAARDIAIHAANAASVILALASLLPVARALGFASALFVATSVVPGAALHGLQSLGRFTSVAFPVFGWLAMKMYGRSRRWLIGVFAIGQMIAAALFFTWRPLI
jgi:hypothetical protein